MRRLSSSKLYEALRLESRQETVAPNGERVAFCCGVEIAPRIRWIDEREGK